MTLNSYLLKLKTQKNLNNIHICSVFAPLASVDRLDETVRSDVAYKRKI